ncbi:unnamed protein product [Pleuronectes platessa]|uniref:Uncharacterized protein n=1 Tax=Pleuronectes platessa TaxID=8262 RepID=A0A9N7TKD7_PLEPL|nr:unnamed protein product [Pleuronectes platessa]
MSHSRGPLPLDPVSWLEVLISAGDGASAGCGRMSKRRKRRVKGGEGESLIHQRPHVIVFISPHLIGVRNVQLSHVSLRGGGQLASISSIFPPADWGPSAQGASHWERSLH